MKPLISRKEAKARGLLRYFTGKPCANGHTDERLVSNWTCCECNRLHVAQWQQQNPEKAAVRVEKWRSRNPGLAAKRASDWYYANTERHRQTMKSMFEANPHLRARLSAAARAKQRQRTPKWLTSDHLWQIDETYDLAALRTTMTGIEWHVDHIVPLRGKKVSGLHVPWNLQVIPAIVNLQKGNRHASG